MSIAFVVIGVFWAGIGVGGLVLLVLGVVGRRVNDHPCCTDCSFDLSGTWPNVETCPECGASISDESAIRFGLRIRRPAHIATGVVLLLLFAASLVMSLTGAGVRSMPTGWLNVQAKLMTGPREGAALTEMKRRLVAGDLSQSQIDAIVSTVLAHQADASRLWQPSGGDFVEAAYGNGALSNYDWGRYAQQALDNGLAIEIRSRVRIGDPIPYKLRLAGMRVGSAPTLAFLISSSVDIGETRIVQVGNIVLGASASSTASFGSRIRVGREQVAMLSPGRHEATFAFTFRFSSTPASAGSSSDVTVSVKTELELVAPEAQVVESIVDPDLKDRVRQSIHSTFAWGAAATDASTRTLECSVEIRQPPVGLSFDVFARVGEKELPMGQFAMPAGAEVTKRLRGQGVAPALRCVELIFRPNPQAARATVDVVEYWDEEVVIEAESVGR